MFYLFLCFCFLFFVFVFVFVFVFIFVFVARLPKFGKTCRHCDPQLIYELHGSSFNLMSGTTLHSSFRDIFGLQSSFNWLLKIIEVSFADLKNIINMCAEGREICQSNQKFLILSALHESLWGLKCSMIIIFIIFYYNLYIILL